jgi:hypothetical protein
MNIKIFMLSMLYVVPAAAMQEEQSAKAVANKQIIIKKLENCCEVADKNPELKFLVSLLNKAYMTCLSPAPAYKCETEYAYAMLIANYSLDENDQKDDSQK